jgi:D-serine deaminase-like pyridoxal phosphate-dependent protein
VKGLPGDFAQGRSVFDGTFPLPTATLMRAELEHNIAIMAAYCGDHGVLLAPHGKTTMSPQLFRRQLAAGAWAITAATAWQASTMAAMGVRRILLANEVVDAGSVRLLAELLNAYPELDLFCYADSPAALAAVEDLPRVRVLVELGMLGGRTGLRDDAEAVALARRVAAGPATLAGVAAFEGIIDGGSIAGTLAQVDELLRRMVSVALAVSDVVGPVPIVTVGGSSYFDRVVEILPSALDTTAYRTVLRSGCYVTHDAGMYDGQSPFGAQPRAPHRFREALRIWAPVLSRPEPTRAIAGIGRRDASTDAGLPVPQVVRRGSTVEDIHPAVRVVAVNDQHAHLELPESVGLDVGDLVGFGISHPCTTFDKWRAIPIVEADGTVVEIAETYF